MRSSFLAVLLGAVCAAGCTVLFPFGDYGFVDDGGADAATDTPAADTPATDTPAADTGLDASIDGALDVPADLFPDAVVADTTLDSPMDTTLDSSTDTTLDSPTDTTLDSPTDSPRDNPGDTGADVPGDLPRDGGTDAGPPCGTLTSCSGACVDLSSNAAHCGACGTACALAHAAPGCRAGGCIVVACEGGYADCDGNPANGCETVTSNNIAACGGCGTVCGSVAHSRATCVFSVCAFTCDTGYLDCDHRASNGCESRLNDDYNCGACGIACGAGRTCVGPAHLCADCGASGTPCCAGGFCSGGMTCTDGMCP